MMMNIKIDNVLSPSLTIFIIVVLSEVVVTFSNPSLDVENLLKFKASLENVGNQMNDWNASNPLCKGTPTWTGVLCEGENVWGLKLEHMGLKGIINVDALKELSNLRTMSLMNNNFEHPFPEIKKLTYMKTIYLSNNNFQGQIPDDAFDGMHSLKKIHLANNKFTGQIPNSLTTLAKLMELSFENNQFSGQIPDFAKDRLKNLNLSNNKLQGPIPYALSSMPASSFSGNQELCGAPLEQCKPYNSMAHMSIATKIIFGIVIVAAAAAITAVIFIQLRHKKSEAIVKEIVVINESSENQKKIEPPSIGKKLSFLREDRTRFDLDDLMNSSAEKLGNGILGSTYKAAVIGGQAVVVKRFKQMNNVDKEEFHEHMRRLGRLNHVNLISLVAFFYRKQEKLLVTDHIESVTLTVRLHGLDWPARLKIIKGITRGLMYLYNELPSLVSPHGHLKSSNVLLSPNLHPILTDFGLLPVVDTVHAQEHMIAYKSPEFKKTGRITKKTDVWSLGILMLEILTGKLPSNNQQQGNGNSVDITTWVQRIIKDDGLTPEVFDKDMKGTKGHEGEIIDMFKIALRCCDVDVDRRWDINEVFQKVEEIKEKDVNGDDYTYSTYDVRSSIL